MGTTKLEQFIAARRRVVRQAVADELRRVREDRGLSIRDVSRGAGIHPSHLARIEAGERDPSIDALVAFATALGHDVSLRLFPATGPRVRDHLQVRMIEALLRVLDQRWKVRLEVPVYRPARGVIDLVLHDRDRGELVSGEGHSVLSSVERQLRWAALKTDSLPSATGWPFQDRPLTGPPSRLLLLRSCAAMHATARDASSILRATYPAATSAAVQSLTGDTTPWPGPAIVWVDIRGTETHVLNGVPRALRRSEGSA